MSPRQPLGCAGPAVRGRAAHWGWTQWAWAHRPLAAIWLVLTGLLMTWAALTPAEALPRFAFDPSLAVQRDYAPSSLPRQFEADLPDVVDTAHAVEFDSDGAVPRHFALATFIVSALRDGARPLAVSAILPRLFNPRAPPSLR